MRTRGTALAIFALLALVTAGCGSRRAVLPDTHSGQSEPCPTAPPEWRGPVSSEGCPVSGMYDPDSSCAIVYVRGPDGTLIPNISHC
jgi:hypothetical protein